jgi:hypothetical protein
MLIKFKGYPESYEWGGGGGRITKNELVRNGKGMIQNPEIHQHDNELHSQTLINQLWCVLSVCFLQGSHTAIQCLDIK